MPTPKSKTKGKAALPEEDVRFTSVKEFMRRMAPPGARDDIEDLPIAPAIVFHIFLLSCVLERTANRECEHHGLTLPQFRALCCITNAGKEGITHSDLCNRLLMSKAPLTGIIDRLEREGFVQRKPDDKDRRVSRIAITPKGEEGWQRVRADLRQHAFRHCSNLTEEEQQTLVDLLARLLENVAKADPMLPEGSLK